MEDTGQLLADMVGRPDKEVDLAETALLIAQEEYPDLDRGRYLGILHHLAMEAKRRIGDEAEPYGIVNALSEYLFDEEGFRGNEDNYYDPRNSFLNEVLDRRLGIPITLSLVYMEVGHRLALPIVGVGMPGHFLVKYLAPGEEIIIDPFHRGIILNEEDCTDLLTRISGRPISFQRLYLASLSKREILTRMLNNLKGIYLARQDYRRALGVVKRLLLINPQDLGEILLRGLSRYRLDDLAGALADLEAYLARAPDAADSDAIRDHVEALRQRLGEQFPH